jgi:RNA-binding protein
MSAPTNPKKRALMASTKLRKTLRAAGHHLSPVVQVGKEGVSDAVLHQLDEQLAAHELVKVKIGTETPEDRFEAAERLGEASGAQIAQILGRTVLVYRKHPDHPRFEPKPKERSPRGLAPARGGAAPARRDVAGGGGRGRGRAEGRAEGRAGGRGGGRAGGRGVARGEGRSGGRAEGRSGGRAEGWRGGRAEGRSGGRAEGRSGGSGGAAKRGASGGRAAAPKRTTRRPRSGR